MRTCCSHRLGLPLVILNFSWFFAYGPSMLIMLCTHVRMSTASHLCETASSLKARSVSPNFPRAPHDTHSSEPSGNEDNSPEDENTGCDQRVGQKGADGHHVHEGLQVKEKCHHSYWEKREQGRKQPVRKLHTVDNFQVRDKWWALFCFSANGKSKCRKRISHS